MTPQYASLDDAVNDIWDYEYDASMPEHWPVRNDLLPRAELGAVWAKSMEMAVSEAAYAAGRMRRLCRSPIEERFLAAMWSCSGWGGGNRSVVGNDGKVAATVTEGETWSSLMRIFPQHKVGPYLADFMIQLKQISTATVAVEVDGHNFHEKTKKQAAHDKKRDRYFASIGLTVLRFTGSEVHKDADQCVYEVMRLLWDKVKALEVGAA